LQTVEDGQHAATAANDRLGGFTLDDRLMHAGFAARLSDSQGVFSGFQRSRANLRVVNKLVSQLSIRQLQLLAASPTSFSKGPASAVPGLSTHNLFVNQLHSLCAPNHHGFGCLACSMQFACQSLHMALMRTENRAAGSSRSPGRS